MYERFTDRARKAMQLANQEACKLNHDYIGTEHVLIGLMDPSVGGIALDALTNMGITQQTVFESLQKNIKSGPDQITLGKLPCTPRVKNVIMYAMEASRELKHNHVGTEHLMLGLIKEEDGIASITLKELDVTRENFLTSCEAVIINYKDSMPVSEQMFNSVLSQFQPLSMKKPEAGTEDFRVEQLKNIASAIYRFSNGECTSETCLTEIRQIIS